MATQAKPLVKKAASSAKVVRTAAPAATPGQTPLQKATEAINRYSAAFRKVAQINKKAAEDAAPHNEIMNAAKLELNQYADGAKATDFGGAKTLKLAGGVIGWKLGAKTLRMPKLDDEKRALKMQATFLGLVETYLPDAVSKEVDSKKLVTAWEGNSEDNLRMVKALKKLGVGVEQKENFFVTASK